ncbi:hypothetical protein F5Y09DRAFT_293367 [Xylaria sp. FL1042]|nr:hypothetical protein F5Y09DRAFT_293363 [Xylaria sp. FL1042]KAI0435349.1 hypothetical protein F5Y09DRAFT_293367 [Xylaria sp. FL1042]
MLLSGPGIIAVSVVAAAAIAIYESPELQRFTHDLRRRIAIALHAFGDSITPQERENLFNRPEDAEGFLRSRGLGPGSMPGVEADVETLRRQREELMYWNAMRESMETKDREDEKRRYRARASTGASSFDDFLKQDENAEKGTYIFQTGCEPHEQYDGVIRRRHNNNNNSSEGSRGLNYSVYTNPFADEHGIEDDIAFENSLMDPGKDEMASDIYSATDLGHYHQAPPSRTLSPEAAPLVEIAPEHPENATNAAITTTTTTTTTTTISHRPPPAINEEELGPDEYMTAGQDDRTREGDADAYSAIQAWAALHASHDASFYSPLPESPAPASEAELISEGELTPTDSASLAGSGVDVAAEVRSARSEFDVLSDEEEEGDDGVHTPTSWTDVESTAGESEGGLGNVIWA